MKLFHQPGKKTGRPKKVLAIRLQALGDTVITLPYLQDLKRKDPAMELHFFTRKEVVRIPESVRLFDKIIVIGGGRNAKLQFLLMLLKLPLCWVQAYDVVIDLQNNRISKILRRLLFPPVWSEFDKWSPISAGERTRLTIEAAGIGTNRLDTNLELKADNSSAILKHAGWKEDHDLIVLNPAGYCSSRSWPLAYYVTFAKRWMENVNPDTQFLLLLLPSLAEKGEYIKHNLGEACINLTGKADQTEAFAMVKRCRLMLSEDSGLMHMAWVQGVPTLALFSSSRKDWSAPQGEWSLCLDSSDMDCGPCGLEVCKFGDNRCLTRYDPDFVVLKAKELLKNAKDLL